MIPCDKACIILLSLHSCRSPGNHSHSQRPQQKPGWCRRVLILPSRFFHFHMEDLPYRGKQAQSRQMVKRSRFCRLSAGVPIPSITRMTAIVVCLSEWLQASTALHDSCGFLNIIKQKRVFDMSWSLFSKCSLSPGGYSIPLFFVLLSLRRQANELIFRFRPEGRQ